MHVGFAGGAFVDTTGALTGITTASTIRGLGVVIPADIAWKVAKGLLEHGRMKRGYVGIAGQPVQLPDREALLVAAVNEDGPAANAGILVGDVILALDGQAITAPEDLMDLLVGDHVGKTAMLRILRGGTPQEVPVTIGERIAS
jgi:S1-C subfamily serine protease